MLFRKMLSGTLELLIMNGVEENALWNLPAVDNECCWGNCSEELWSC
jgi:hypothetical protein